VSFTFSNETLQVAFDGSPHGVIVSGEDGAILFANETAGTIFACAPDRLIGQPASGLLHDAMADNDPFLEFWKNPAHAPIINRGVAGKRADGVMVPLEMCVNGLVDDVTRCAVASFTDITEKLRLEARIAHATNGDLDFHRLVADVASRLVAIDDAEAVDDAVVDSMRRVGEALTFDRAILWMKEPGESVAVPTHYWEQPAGASPPAPVPIAAIPYVTSRLHAGEVSWFSNLDEVPDPVDRETFRSRGLKAAIWVPLTSTNDPEDKLAVLAFSSTASDHECTPAMIGRLPLVAGVMGQALARKAGQQALRRAFDEIDQLRGRLGSENLERREKKVVRSPRTVVAGSRAIQQVLAQVAQVAPTPATVLLLGETGTGKEVMAQVIHDASPRHQRPMVRVSCAAIPIALIESELFGRERGAFTGALSRQIGRFEAANQSTLFLDEIGELPTEVQVKLLRVLQERVIERLGSTQPIKVDVRIIAATNRNLETAVQDKTFREDLYYRLNVFPIELPPLRERIDDIPTLVGTFIDEYSRAFGKPIEPISKENMRELQRYSWPGNVRELRNVVERAVILATGRTLVVPAPRPAEQGRPQAPMTLVGLEVEHIRAVLESTNWRIRGSGGAAERLGLKPTTLESRMAKYGLTRKQIE